MAATTEQGEESSFEGGLSGCMQRHHEIWAGFGIEEDQDAKAHTVQRER